MKLNEILPELTTGRAMIRREIWDTDVYLTYDFATDMPRTSAGDRASFTMNDVLAEDWTFVETLEQKKLEKLFEILNDFHNTEGLDARVYKDDLLKVLRME